MKRLWKALLICTILLSSMLMGYFMLLHLSLLRVMLFTGFCSIAGIVSERILAYLDRKYP